jgi:hypothetical protein
VGALAVINVAVATIVQLGSFGLPSSNTYFIAQDSSALSCCRHQLSNLRARHRLDSRFVSQSHSGFATRLVWFCFTRLDSHCPPSRSRFKLVVLIGLNILLALGKIKEFNLLDLAGQSFVLINAVLVLLVLKQGLATLVTLNTAATIFVSIVVTLLLVISGKSVLQSKWRADMALLRRMIGYGLKFHISILAGAIIIRADLLVVNHFRGCRGSRRVQRRFTIRAVADAVAWRDCDAALSTRHQRTGCAWRDHLPRQSLHDVRYVPVLPGGGAFESAVTFCLWSSIFRRDEVAADTAPRRLPDGPRIGAGPTLQCSRAATGHSALLGRDTRFESRSRVRARSSLRRTGCGNRVEHQLRRYLRPRSRFTFTPALADPFAEVFVLGACADESCAAGAQWRLASLARQTGPNFIPDSSLESISRAEFETGSTSKRLKVAARAAS